MKFCFETKVPDTQKTVCVDAFFKAALHCSHWPGNSTPSELRGDTSTDIVFRLLHSPGREKYLDGLEYVANNHFDADGLIAVFALLEPEIALASEQFLRHIATTGDFREYTSDEALQACIVLENLETGRKTVTAYPEHVEQLYREGITILKSLISDVHGFENVWKKEFAHFLQSENAFHAKQSFFSNYQDCNLTVIETAQVLHEVSLVSTSEHDRILLCRKAGHGKYFYSLNFKPATWFDTTRGYPSGLRVNLATLAEELNHISGRNGGTWSTTGNSPAAAYDYKLLFHDGLFREIPCELPIFTVEEKVINYLLDY